MTAATAGSPSEMPRYLRLDFHAASLGPGDERAWVAVTFPAPRPLAVPNTTGGPPEHPHWEKEEVPSHYPAPWSGSATGCCSCPRRPLPPPGCQPCRLCPAAGFGGCSARPTHLLRRLDEQKQAGSTRPPSHPPASPPGHSHRHSHVSLSPSAAWHTRYLASAPGQVARGDGSHRRTAASALALMRMEEASEAARHQGGTGAAL